MDLFFVAALGWGARGGLDVGQAFHVAAQITDGDGDTGCAPSPRRANCLDAQADDWLARGARRNAGEARLQAFAAYPLGVAVRRRRAAFAAPYARHQRAFAQAIDELDVPATFFQVPWQAHSLPGVFLPNADARRARGAGDRRRRHLLRGPVPDRRAQPARARLLGRAGRPAGPGHHGGRGPALARRGGDADRRRHGRCWSSASARSRAASRCWA